MISIHIKCEQYSSNSGQNNCFRRVFFWYIVLASKISPFKFTMKKLFLSFLFMFSMSLLFGQSQTKTDEIYTYKTPDRDGTGKVYMGREISQVMNFMGMSWLERSTRPQEENTELAIKNLPIDKKSVVADIGAGSGYYTFRIAKKVPEGKVYAVEIQDPAIKYLQDRSKELGFFAALVRQVC